MTFSGYSADGSGVYRTPDYGSTWIKVDTSSSGYNYSAVSFANGKMYMGVSNKYFISKYKPFMASRIITSTDKGESWTKIDTPIDTGKVFTSLTDTIPVITSLYGVGSNLLVGTKPYYYNSNGGGIYHLYFDGSKWTVVDTVLTNRQVFGLAASGPDIFAATDSGIYQSTINKKNWENVSLGMNHLNVSSLFISGSYLYASTTNGLWKRPLSEITAIEKNPSSQAVPNEFILSQNYPNPFNPTTTINYQLARNSRVRLTVSNILGRRVATLVDENEQKGTHMVTFNASQLASGVYFYRLQPGSKAFVKKMLLMK